ncbi:hypothetical protein [endosymbiont GvMRE of Glomus versiforme]|uniref:hypothetical protein n=1 Tax=endosymbiont GvMRE of Glomus versiforme TaxID=2039283 RepID=UPI0011C3F899|nr:hypothetical protein [endosymbiont GvMRE of Glomus versiforme]
MLELEEISIQQLVIKTILIASTINLDNKKLVKKIKQENQQLQRENKLFKELLKQLLEIIPESRLEEIKIKCDTIRKEIDITQFESDEQQIELDPINDYSSKNEECTSPFIQSSLDLERLKKTPLWKEEDVKQTRRRFQILIPPKKY